MARRRERQTKPRIGGRSPHTYTTQELKQEIIHFMSDFEKYESDEYKNFMGLGVWDTGILSWLLRVGVIRRKGEGYAVEPQLYDRFQTKRALLEEYWGRVEFAEKQED